MAVFDLPQVRLEECTFTLDDGTVSSPFNSGKALNVTQVADPAWRVKIRTVELPREDRQLWTAWKARLRGGLNRFSAYDVSHSAPLHYLGASAPEEISAGWDGTAGVSALGVSGALTLTGVPVGFVASEGDRVSLSQSGAVGYYEILTAATASGVGVLELAVSPFLHTGYFTTAAVALLWRPKAMFALDWRTWDLAVTANPTPASFEGFQVIK